MPTQLTHDTSEDAKAKAKDNDIISNVSFSCARTLRMAINFGTISSLVRRMNTIFCLVVRLSEVTNRRLFTNHMKLKHAHTVE